MGLLADERGFFACPRNTAHIRWTERPSRFALRICRVLFIFPLCFAHSSCFYFCSLSPRVSLYELVRLNRCVIYSAPCDLICVPSVSTILFLFLYLPSNRCI